MAKPRFQNKTAKPTGLVALDQGTEVWESGVVISVKDKVGKRGPFIGVTFKAFDGYLYWFAWESWMSPERPRVNFPIEVVGYISGQTDDLELRFLEDVSLINSKEGEEERKEKAGNWFEMTSEARSYNEETKAQRKEEEKAASTIAVEGDLPLGIFTVGLDDGSYRTIRVKPPIKNAFIPDFEGWQFIGYLSGQDNTSDYNNFAFRKAGADVVTLKAKFREDSDLVTCLRALLASDKSTLREMGIRFAKGSGICFVCGRTLTTPESIEAGIGPVCAAKGGW